MAYNKKAHLRDNIEAIRIAFDLERDERHPTPDEREMLAAYSGFGGIKAVLNPAIIPEDIEKWPKTADRELFPLIAELHGVLKNGSANMAEYNRYVSSLKNSVLTAFYTPPRVVDALVSALVSDINETSLSVNKGLLVKYQPFSLYPVLACAVKVAVLP